MLISLVSRTYTLLYYYEEIISSERSYSILKVNISRTPSSSVLRFLVLQQWGMAEYLRTVTPNGLVVPASDYR
jgi:hypothetical protein